MVEKYSGTYSGKVVKGLQNGRKFGFPTANILLDDLTSVPEKGVYAVYVFLSDQRYGGMLYVGTRPTLYMQELSVEINIFGFSGLLYGQTLRFTIVKKIRDDRKFDSVDQLIEQIKKDQYEAHTLLDV